MALCMSKQRQRLISLIRLNDCHPTHQKSCFILSSTGETTGRVLASRLWNSVALLNRQCHLDDVAIPFCTPTRPIAINAYYMRVRRRNDFPYKLSMTRQPRAPAVIWYTLTVHRSLFPVRLTLSKP